MEGSSREDFLVRVQAALEFLENAVSDGRIGVYGTATWNGYRRSPGSRDYLSLAELDEVARKVGARTTTSESSSCPSISECRRL